MGDCSCIYVDVDEYNEVQVETIRRARKQHKCYECHRPILRGEEYEETTALFDGSWNRYHTCLDCVSVRKAFFCQGYYFGMIWEDTCEHIKDCWNTTPVEALSKLTPAARESVCKMIEEQWAEMEDDNE